MVIKIKMSVVADVVAEVGGIDQKPSYLTPPLNS